MTKNEDLLTVPEVSDILGYSVKHIYGLLLDGTLKYVNVSRGMKKKRYLVPRKFIEEFLDDRTVR